MHLRGVNTRAEVCANQICNSRFHTYRHERLQTMKQRASERHQQESEDVRQAHLLRDAHAVFPLGWKSNRVEGENLNRK